MDEDIFLEKLFPKLLTDSTVVIPPGDDCGALSLREDRLLLLTIDQLSEGVHYRIPEASPEEIGHKLLARSLSDIAAMGGEPAYALIAISIPPSSDQKWLSRCYEGLLCLAKLHKVTIVGGDISSGKINSASATVLGWISPKDVCRRNSAKAGDAILVTGECGGSIETRKHLNFQPRVKEGRWLAIQNMTKAMIDISDGLLKDLDRMCQASQVEAILWEDKIPRSVLNHTPVSIRQALLDGEDYELLFSVAKKKLATLYSNWPFVTRLTEIGLFTNRYHTTGRIWNTCGEDIGEKYDASYNHFSLPNAI